MYTAYLAVKNKQVAFFRLTDDCVDKVVSNDLGECFAFLKSTLKCLRDYPDSVEFGFYIYDGDTLIYFERVLYFRKEVKKE